VSQAVSQPARWSLVDILDWAASEGADGTYDYVRRERFFGLESLLKVIDDLQAEDTQAATERRTSREHSFATEGALHWLTLDDVIVT